MIIPILPNRVSTLLATPSPTEYGGVMSSGRTLTFRCLENCAFVVDQEA